MRDGMSVDRAVARGGVETGGLRIQHPRYLAGKAPEAKIRSRARMAMADEEGDGPGRLSWSLVAVLRRWSSPRRLRTTQNWSRLMA